MILFAVAFLDKLAIRCSGHQIVTAEAALVVIQHGKADVVGQIKCIVVDIGAARFACNVDAQLILESQ